MTDEPDPRIAVEPYEATPYAQTVPFLQTARNGFVRISAIDWIGYDPTHGTRTCVAIGGADATRIPVLGTLDEVMAVCGFGKATVVAPTPQPTIEPREPEPRAGPTDAHRPISSKSVMDKQGQ